jgi:lysophospholipase L1-like esterase
VGLGKRFSPLILILILSAASARAANDPTDSSKPYPEPQRFEKNIAAFELADQKNSPTPGGIVCIGSSSMVAWHATIQKDLAPLKIIARGFGGSNMNDALYYVDRMVIRYRPRAVVLYEGDNDIAGGITPRRIAETFKLFVAAIHKQLPDTRVYVLSIKPSPSRWSMWPKSMEANTLLRAACAEDKRLTYVSIVETMMMPDGKVKEDIFKADRLHMNAAGYALWRDAVRPILLAKELVASVTEKAMPLTTDR